MVLISVSFASPPASAIISRIRKARSRAWIPPLSRPIGGRVGITLCVSSTPLRSIDALHPILVFFIERHLAPLIKQFFTWWTVFLLGENPGPKCLHFAILDDQSRPGRPSAVCASAALVAKAHCDGFTPTPSHPQPSHHYA